MEYRKFDSTVVVRLDPGDEIVASLLNVAAEEGITLASVSGLGASDDIRVCVWNGHSFDETHLTGSREITSLVGNLTTMNGAPYAHLHITCAEKGGAVSGGHLLACVISLTAEIFLHVTEAKVERKHSDALGINILSFE